MSGSAAPGARRVLVVDDDPQVADSLADLLCALGFDAYAGYDATQAVRIARRLMPEAAIVDLALPDTHGAELAQRLRREHSGLLLIALTGYPGAAALLARASAPFDHYLLKPVDIDQLEALLGSA